MKKNYSIELGVVTVSELIETLQSLPKRYKNWPVYCGGTDLFLCVNEDEHCIALDMEDLFEENDDLEDFIGTKRTFPWD